MQRRRARVGERRARRARAGGRGRWRSGGGGARCRRGPPSVTNVMELESLLGGHVTDPLPGPRPRSTSARGDAGGPRVERVGGGVVRGGGAEAGAAGRDPRAAYAARRPARRCPRRGRPGRCARGARGLRRRRRRRGGDDGQSLVHGFVGHQPPGLAEVAGRDGRHHQDVRAGVEVAQRGRIEVAGGVDAGRRAAVPASSASPTSVSASPGGPSPDRRPGARAAPGGPCSARRGRRQRDEVGTAGRLARAGGSTVCAPERAHRPPGARRGRCARRARRRTR